jgi:hypothetical protein
MGKISDIWVRLGLKKDDFDKGMDDAAKKTEGVGASFGKMKAAALAVWAAIGTAVVKFAQDLIASTNRMGDAWAVFTSQSKAAWDTFLSAVSSWDFSNFFGRLKEATMEAAEFAKAMDAAFEINNSIALQRAAMSKELAALRVVMQDATKPFDERIKAGEEYLAKISPIYDQIVAEAKRMEDAHLGKWLAGAGLGNGQQVREDLRKFLVEIGKNTDMLALLQQYSEAQKTIDKGVNALGSNYGKVTQAYKDRNAIAKVIAEMQEGYSTDLIAMFRAYNDMRGDKDTAPLVQAMIDAYNASAAKDNETREIQSVVNGLINQQTTKAIADAAKQIKLEDVVGELIDSVEDDLKGIEDIELEAPEIDLTAFDTAEERLKQFTEQWRAEQEKIAQYNQMIGDAIVASMGNGLQAITDMMFGLEGADMKNVLAAFIAPLGDTMKQIGAMIMAEGIAMLAFKKSFQNPATAIAAGAALMTIGSMVSSGLQRLTANPAGGGGAVATTGASGADTESIKTELTVYVEGKISGKDIVLSGNKTLNSWRR